MVTLVGDARAIEVAVRERLAASSRADIIVFGHTHKPYTKLRTGELPDRFAADIESGGAPVAKPA